MLIIYHKKEGHLSLGPSYLKCEVLAVPNGTFVFACGSSPRAIAYFVLLLWVSRLAWSAHSLDYPTSLSFGSLAAHRRALSPILFCSCGYLGSFRLGRLTASIILRRYRSARLRLIAARYRLFCFYSPKAMVTFSLGLTLEIAIPFGSTR